MADVGRSCPGALRGTAENSATPSTKHAFQTSPVFVSSFEKITLIGLKTKVKVEVYSNLNSGSYNARLLGNSLGIYSDLLLGLFSVLLQLMISIKVLLESIDSTKNGDLEDLEDIGL